MDQGPSNEFEWTTGNDPTIFHRRRVATGGNGEVHEVKHTVIQSLTVLDDGD